MAGRAPESQNSQWLLLRCSLLLELISSTFRRRNISTTILSSTKLPFTNADEKFFKASDLEIYHSCTLTENSY